MVTLIGYRKVDTLPMMEKSYGEITEIARKSYKDSEIEDAKLAGRMKCLAKQWSCYQIKKV